ncbi:ATP-dependent carboxylate-amine ligase [Micromonospora craterilacus]|uniref:ATP-dependent carboxylate-amine ligase n=1 Tax=Micromonospora craterilacus TaxID=1655439 RepID=A0A2W2DXG2_9ACTN|nr:ATP-grasp ribosomal peptide maturase [Micromonospora craterilacus]PZG16492.1 ATP-dependent carboxylate-amine ligase [Micromonospora craterilacus]
MTVLVITEPFDETADLVIEHLNERGTSVHRFDLADFPIRLAVTATIDGHGQWAGTTTDPWRTTSLADVSAVFYRRPGPFRFPDTLSEFEYRWAAQEARMGVGGILTALPNAAVWVNDPDAMAAADFKPRQLSAAARHGLRIPPTLITNDAAEARRFVDASPAGAVYKPFHARPYVDHDGRAHGVSTTPVTAGQITDAVAGTAHLFQQQIHKDHELRVTAVNGRLFTARIDAHSDAARVDWRTDYDSLTYERADLPEPTASQLRALLADLGLVFAAVDIIVTPGGEYVFLEVNSGGQWAWIEHETGLPIAAAIADTLEQT